MASYDPLSDSGDTQHDPLDKTATENGGVSEGHGTLATIENRLPSVPSLNWPYGPPPRPEILSAKPNPVELLHAVRRRWTLALGIGATVAIIAAAIVWFLMPVKYEAYALLKVSAAQKSVLESTNTASEEFAVFKRSQVQLILSNVVLNGTLRDRGINQLSIVREHKEDPVSWLKGQLIIDYPDDAELMRVAMKGKVPGEVVKIVNQVVKVYLAEIVERDKQQKLSDEEKLRRAHEQQTSEYEKQLAALRNLETIHKTSGSEEAMVKKRLAIEELNADVQRRADLIEDIAKTNMEIRRMNTKKKFPKEMTPPDVMVESEVANDPIIYQMSQALLGLTDQLNSARAAAATPESSGYVQELQRKRLNLEELIDERKGELRPKVLALLMAKNEVKEEGATPLTIDHLEDHIEYLEEQLKESQKKVEEKTAAVGSLDSFSAQVANAQENLAQLRMIKDRVGAQIDQAVIERLAPDRITQIDEAMLANSRGDAMQKYVAVSFAFLLCFGLVVLGVAFMEFQSRKVNSVKEVNDGLGIRVVGELPSIRGRAFRRVRGGKGQAVLKALMAERIDGTRTALIHTTAVDPPRIIMVTSAEPHEGKTTTCSQLAASLARSGRRTLFIDADIRNPGAHRVFEIPQDPGLCELLRGEADREAVIHPTRTANLWLMPAGRCDLRSVQALSSSYLGTVIAALAVQFDYLIIDSGPVLKVADPLLVGQHVDAAMVSVLRDVSKVPNVYDAVERLRSVGITVLGSVVNGVKDDVARHGVELLMAETPKKAAAETSTAS